MDDLGVPLFSETSISLSKRPFHGLSIGITSYLRYPYKVDYDMDVSKNSGTPNSSILMRFSIINHPFRGTTIFGNTHIPPGTVEILKKILVVTVASWVGGRAVITVTP